MGSHSAWYVLIVPHISECWSGDGLIRPKYGAAKKYYYYTLYNSYMELKSFIGWQYYAFGREDRSV